MVDDNELIHKLVDVYLLDDTSFEVCGSARNGAQGVALAADLRPDAVLLDYEMPILNGLEALPRIRKAAPGATIVMYTSAEDDGLYQKAQALGAGYFVKGVDDIEEVLAALRG